MENKVLCRKCGGPHFTIKCGKEKKEEPVKVESDTKPQYTDAKTNNGDREYKHRDKGDRDYKHRDNGDKDNEHKKEYGDRENRPRGDRKYFKTTYRVKLSELPLDMTEEELMELTTDWGHIVRIKLLVYTDNSTAYIDFGYEDEADYFVEAIDKTPLEYKLLTACRVESYRGDKPNENNTEA
jgi:hypothetical protein